MFKEHFGLREMLLEAMNRNKLSRDSDTDGIKIALFMPESSKKQWIKQILDLLSIDGQFKSTKFKVFIL